MLQFGKHIFRNILTALTAAVALPIFSSCEHEELFPDGGDKVLIYYCAAHNNLSSSILQDIRDIRRNLPHKSTLLIYSHQSNKAYSPAPAHLILAHPGAGETTVLDTVAIYPSVTSSADPNTLRSVLEYAVTKFPGKEYGLIFTSHGTGFLPEGYYDNSVEIEREYADMKQEAGGEDQAEDDDMATQQKTIGADYKYIDGVLCEEAIDIRDFADAFPCTFDYIILDACLMGGIEVAYQLRDKARYLIASPTEIITDGMDYINMPLRIFSDKSLRSRMLDICEDYYNLYKDRKGQYCSASIALINLSKLEPVARKAAQLFSDYRSNLDAIDPSRVQRYYTYSYHWFYDFGDIISHMDCSGIDKAEFDTVLEACIVYKAHTPTFLYPWPGFAINKFSGLSMYLPANGGDFLSDYYRNLDWNIATGLVPDEE